MPTPHNEASKENIAKIVLTSGDPKRCEYIAKNYLENVKLVNSVRGMTAYTGEYKGKRITIFPMGMGMPSLGIYAYELYKFYDVETIIRMGTCGTTDPNMTILDTIFLEGSYTESNFALMVNRDNKTHLSYASRKINDIIEQVAKEENISYKKGFGSCSEVFDVYLSEEQYKDMLEHLPKEIDIIAVEMEAFALFYIANMLGKNAACLLTLVDSRYKKGEVVTSEAREKKLDNMIKIALNASLKL